MVIAMIARNSIWVRRSASGTFGPAYQDAIENTQIAFVVNDSSSTGFEQAQLRNSHLFLGFISVPTQWERLWEHLWDIAHDLLFLAYS